MEKGDGKPGSPTSSLCCLSRTLNNFSLLTAALFCHLKNFTKLAAQPAQWKAFSWRLLTNGREARLARETTLTPARESHHSYQVALTQPEEEVKPGFSHCNCTPDEWEAGTYYQSLVTHTAFVGDSLSIYIQKWCLVLTASLHLVERKISRW